jgi:hypothetical protein
MIFVAYTGKGWVTYALVPLTFAFAMVVGLAVDDSPDQKLLGAGIAAVLVAVVGTPAQWVIGRALNGDTARLGWAHVEHTTYGIPMELTAPFYPAAGLVMLAFVVGAATSALWGWLLFAAAALPAALLVREARRRRPPPG